jgi:bacterioferritin
MSDGTSPVTDLLNDLIGIYYTALPQHQTHVALLHAWGIDGLAAGMQARIDDEPVTIATLTNRLLELDGQPKITLGTPNIGTTLREVLENDLSAQRNARPDLNAAAERAADAHDATTRVLLEGILADEEQHLSWLQTELELLDKLGEPLYIANRLGAPTTAAPA